MNHTSSYSRPEVGRHENYRGPFENRPNLNERTADLVRKPLKIKKCLLRNSVYQSVRRQKPDLRVVMHRQEPADPWKYKHRHGQYNRYKKLPPAA